MMKILFFNEEEEEEYRHLCFRDEVFPLLSAPIKVLNPDYTHHSPAEIWISTTLLTLRLIAEEEQEEVEDEIDTCIHCGCDGFLLLFVAMFQLAAMRRTHPGATDIIRIIQQRIREHELYAPLFYAVKDKEKQRRERGKAVDLEHYQPISMGAKAQPDGSKGEKDGSKGESASGMEIVRALVDIAIKHGNTEMCDTLEFLLQRLNSQQGYCFEKEIKRLGGSTDKANEQAHEPRVNAREYNKYESGATHEDHRRQINVEPASNALLRGIER